VKDHTVFRVIYYWHGERHEHSRRPEKEETITELPKTGMVPHTPEREAFLEQMLVALKSLDGKLHELFRGRSEDVGVRIDGMTPPQLMSGE
jgi:hypothetical protein